MRKIPVGCRFIIASKKCSTKPLTEVVSKIFKLLFSSVDNFYKKSRFYSRLNKFWVVQNSFPVTEKLDKINVKKMQNVSPLLILVLCILKFLMIYY